jgi:gluconolactonase
MTLRILASGLKFPEGPVAQRDGSVLFVEIQRQTLSRVLHDGTVTVVMQLDGGPNGLAVGPDGALYICNNGGFLFQESDGLTRTRPGAPEGYSGGWIERIDPATGERKILYDRCGGHRLRGPNDLVFDRRGGFYFADFGKLWPRSRDNGGLYYAQADGSEIVEVAYPLIMPNGVGLSADETVLYTAETETGRLWAFDLAEPGVARKHPFPSPHGGRLICGLPGYQRFDSLALEANGNICVATLRSGCITVISPEGEVLRQVETLDPITTNICFGGPDRRTAYITLSGLGQLVAMDWPEPGLPLAFEF